MLFKVYSDTIMDVSRLHTGYPLTPQLPGPNKTKKNHLLCSIQVWVFIMKTAWRVLFTCSCCSSLVFPSHSLVFVFIWFSCFCCWCNRSAFCLLSSCLENWPPERHRERWGSLRGGQDTYRPSESHALPAWSSLGLLRSFRWSWSSGSSWTWPCVSWPRCAGSWAACSSPAAVGPWGARSYAGYSTASAPAPVRAHTDTGQTRVSAAAIHPVWPRSDHRYV